VLHNHDGTFAARTDHRAGGFGNNALSATIGDVNGDGRLDVVTATGDLYSQDGDDAGYLTVLLNAGRGRLLPRRDWFGKLGSDYGVAAIGDLNGDGRPDVVVTNPPFGGISVFRNVTKR